MRQKKLALVRPDNFVDGLADQLCWDLLVAMTPFDGQFFHNGSSLTVELHRFQKPVMSGYFLRYDKGDNIQNLQNLRMLDGIKNLQSVLATRKCSGRQHHVEVAGSIGLLLGNGGVDFTNAPLSIAQKIDDL